MQISYAFLARFRYIARLSAVVVEAPQLHHQQSVLGNRDLNHHKAFVTFQNLVFIPYSNVRPYIRDLAAHYLRRTSYWTWLNYCRKVQLGRPYPMDTRQADDDDIDIFCTQLKLPSGSVSVRELWPR